MSSLTENHAAQLVRTDGIPADILPRPTDGAAFQLHTSASYSDGPMSPDIVSQIATFEHIAEQVARYGRIGEVFSITREVVGDPCRVVVWSYEVLRQGEKAEQPAGLSQGDSA